MINKDWRGSALKLANDYCAIEGIQRTTLAARIVGDADFFDRLEKGSNCFCDTLLSVKNWFRKNKPIPKKSKARRQR